MPAAIRVQGLTKVFLSRDGSAVKALERIDLELAAGSFTCLVGSTGCGKTTLLRIIAGLEPPTAGRVELNGAPVTGPRRDAAMVFQQYSLLPWRSVLDNVAFGLEVRGMPAGARRTRAIELLNLVGLADSAGRRPYELSGGMQQRVAIARALAPDPEVLLLDEPFGALDERTRHRLQEELLAIWEQTRKTIIFVTHSIDEAVYLGERIVVLADRPSRIADDLVPGLKRPRDRIAPAFVETLLRVRAVLETAMRSDAGGAITSSDEGERNEKTSDTRCGTGCRS